MGTTISIGIYVAHADAPQAFANLMNRILASSTFITAEEYEGDVWSHPSKKLGAAVLADVHPLVDALLDSRNALNLRLVYTLVSRNKLALDLDFYGTGYEEGWDVRDNGHLRLLFELSDLNEPWSDLRAREPDIPRSVLIDRCRPIITANAVELFLRACGGLADMQDDPLVRHGAMYLENGWPSAAGCIMLYHRDVAEFARDFGRIYAKYEFGTPMPFLLESGRDIWRMSAEELVGGYGPGKANPDFYRQFVVEPPDDILRFLAGLDRATAQELSALPAEFVHAALREVQTHVPEVQVHDLGERGMALTTTPPGGIWRAYQYLASVTRA